MDLHLITAVCEKEVLWNENSLGYGNVEAQNKAWEEISSKLDSDVESTVRTWNQLRESFESAYDEMKSQVKETGNKEAWKSCSFSYFNMMMFLKPQEKLKTTESVSNIPTAFRMSNPKQTRQKTLSPMVSEGQKESRQIGKRSLEELLFGDEDSKRRRHSRSLSCKERTSKTRSPFDSPYHKGHISLPRPYRSQPALRTSNSDDTNELRKKQESRSHCNRVLFPENSPGTMLRTSSQIDMTTLSESLKGIEYLARKERSASSVLPAKLTHQQQTSERQTSSTASGTQSQFGEINSEIEVVDLTESPSPPVNPSQKKEFSPMASAMQDDQRSMHCASSFSVPDCCLPFKKRSYLSPGSRRSKPHVPSRVSESSCAIRKQGRSPFGRNSPNMAPVMRSAISPSICHSPRGVGGFASMASHASPTLRPKLPNQQHTPEMRPPPTSSALNCEFGEGTSRRKLF